MQVDDFEAALEALGWRYADFARRVDVEPSTIYRWRTGRTPIPKWVGEYLGMAQELQRLHARYVAPMRGAKDEPEQPD